MPFLFVPLMAMTWIFGTFVASQAAHFFLTIIECSATATSENLSWRGPSFKSWMRDGIDWPDEAYADHIATEEFAVGLYELLMLAGGLRAAIMCAEILWWRCHRRLIADVLTSLSLEVFHLRNNEPGELHRLAPPARLVGGILTYVPPRT